MYNISIPTTGAKIMKWEDREESQNVEDQTTGMGKKAGLAIGGVGGIIVLILALVFGLDPQKLGLKTAPTEDNQEQKEDPKDDPQTARQKKFTRVILRDTEIVWEKLFKDLGRRYEKPVLVMFSGSVDSACGRAGASVGPFYCPGDSRVYIDLTFYEELEKKLKSPGEFARAYVIAHEVGHHVQRLLGYSKKADDARGTARENEMSVRLELQADYLAGVWAHHGQKEFKFLEPGDIDNALNAAFQIGDDTLKKRGGGRVVPEKFTHGTSVQRVYWFKKGFETGDVKGAGKLFTLPYDRRRGEVIEDD